ncbi:hypothetical protein [Nocardia donostiensis]|uniref:hypothetical protein n=1 Tax=Nocardia donostiensis TaxID=1538463 RepID=UPI0020CB5010|nr:hypothetical protein [Nocardia donostiensis]
MGLGTSRPVLRPWGGHGLGRRGPTLVGEAVREGMLLGDGIGERGRIRGLRVLPSRIGGGAPRPGYARRGRGIVGGV